MNLVNPENIEEQIIKLLQKKSLSGMDLLVAIEKVRPKTTKQAVYSILRKLKKDEIVVTHGKMVSLSSLWIARMGDFFTTARHYYTNSAVGDEGFFNLSAGERVSYTFHNPSTTDIFWGHAFAVLAEMTPTTEPIYIWNPHEWFFLVRGTSEKMIFDTITATGKQILLACANKDPLDKYVAKEFDGKNSQYHMTDQYLFEKKNYYINVFGDFVIEVWLDETTSDAIDVFYKKTPEWDDSAQKEITDIATKKGKTKMTISNNPKKAQKIRKGLEKYFWVRK